MRALLRRMHLKLLESWMHWRKPGVGLGLKPLTMSWIDSQTILRGNMERKGWLIDTSIAGVGPEFSCRLDKEKVLGDLEEASVLPFRYVMEDVIDGLLDVILYSMAEAEKGG